MAEHDQSELLSSLKIEREPFKQPAGRRWLWIVLLGLAVLLAAFFGSRFGQASTLEIQRTQAVRLTGSEPASSVLDASGYVVARRQATVSSKVTGKVMELHIEEGASFSAGEILARIDDSNIRAQVALSRAQLVAAEKQQSEVRVQLLEARRNLKRSRELAGRKLLSQSTLDAAQASVDTLEARLQSVRQNVVVSRRALELQQQQLEDTIVRAPFDGVITVKNAQPGEMISPLSAGGDGTRTGIGTLVDMDSLEVEVDVNENVINRVRAEQPVETRLNAYPDWKIPSRVIAVIPTADRSKATVKVRIALEAKDDRILPEMGARVSFLQAEGSEQSPSEAGVRIASSALYQDGEKSVVYLIKSDRLQRRAVKVGQRNGTRVDILAGLRGGEWLAIAAPESLADGIEVQVADEESR